MVRMRRAAIFLSGTGGEWGKSEVSEKKKKKKKEEGTLLKTHATHQKR